MNMTMIAQKPAPVKGRTTINQDGVTVYRSTLMEEPAARRFCRCLQANTSRAAHAMVHRSVCANPPRNYVVLWMPAAVSRRADLHAHQQNMRASRAAEQASGYTWHDDADRPGMVYCVSPDSEVYEVTPRSCNCPDWECRGRKASLRCKHMIMAANTGQFAAPATSDLCPNCGGKGVDDAFCSDEPCSRCNGTGRRALV